MTAIVLLTFLHNQLRFGDPFEVGYRFLGIAWQHRIEKWGLFGYHYLAKNLGVVLTSLPFWTPRGAAPFQINVHGLALWITTPVYLWLLWPRRTAVPHRALWITVACVALPTLFYQNTGWVQFGYRFSNDYAVFLFALLAVGGYRFGRLFRVLCLRCRAGQRIRRGDLRSRAIRCVLLSGQHAAHRLSAGLSAVSRTTRSPGWSLGLRLMVTFLILLGFTLWSPCTGTLASFSITASGPHLPKMV